MTLKFDCVFVESVSLILAPSNNYELNRFQHILRSTIQISKVYTTKWCQFVSSELTNSHEKYRSFPLKSSNSHVIMKNVGSFQLLWLFYSEQTAFSFYLKNALTTENCLVRTKTEIQHLFLIYVSVNLITFSKKWNRLTWRVTHISVDIFHDLLFLEY